MQMKNLRVVRQMQIKTAMPTLLAGGIDLGLDWWTQEIKNKLYLAPSLFHFMTIQMKDNSKLFMAPIAWGLLIIMYSL